MSIWVSLSIAYALFGIIVAVETFLKIGIKYLPARMIAAGAVFMVCFWPLLLVLFLARQVTRLLNAVRYTR